MSFVLSLPFLPPIELLLLDDSISQIKGNRGSCLWYERDRIVRRHDAVPLDAARLRKSLEVIANQLGKELDQDSPVLRAQLPHGSRLAAWIPPVRRPAPPLTIRKFTSRQHTVDDLIARGTLSWPLANFLEAQIRDLKTFLIIQTEFHSGRRVVCEVLRLKGYDRSAKQFPFQSIYEVDHETA